MTTIAIAVLAILLAALIFKNTKEELKNFFVEYKGFIKQLFSESTKVEFLDDIKHVGQTVLKALGQIGRAAKLIGYWSLIPLSVIVLPVLAVLVSCVEAYRK